MIISSDQNIFVNCPFDAEYEPILQALLFCIIYLGLTPKIASETQDSAQVRIDKIRNLIEESRFSIHDISRCQARESGEFYRLNMPFELGIDYGCREFGNKDQKKKKILILEEEKYRYQAALSDLSGCDISQHSGSYEIAVRKVRNWLVNEAGATNRSAAKILGAYVDFQGWHYKKQVSAGFSEEDIEDYPTKELMQSMLEWMESSQPL